MRVKARIWRVLGSDDYIKWNRAKHLVKWKLKKNKKKHHYGEIYSHDRLHPCSHAVTITSLGNDIITVAARNVGGRWLTFTYTSCCLYQFRPEPSKPMFDPFDIHSLETDPSFMTQIPCLYRDKKIKTIHRNFMLIQNWNTC